MTNRQMEYLIAIYHEGCIRKAADKLFISQPALSQQLQRLEAEIGIKLFERNTAFLKPTYEGKHYLEMLEQVLIQFDQERIWQNESKNLIHGKISIGISPSRSTQFLPKLLPRFHESYPGIQIELREEYMLFLPDLLLKNEIDFALMVLDTFVEDFTFLPLLQEHLVLVAPTDSHADLLCRQSCSHTGHINIEELAAEPFLAIKNGGRIRKKTNEIFEKHNIIPNIILETKNTDLALQLCSTGYGISIVAELIAQAYQNVGSFHCYSLEHEIEPWTLGIAYHPDHYVSSAMDTFIRMTQEEAKHQFLCSHV